MDCCNCGRPLKSNIDYPRLGLGIAPKYFCTKLCLEKYRTEQLEAEREELAVALNAQRMLYQSALDELVKDKALLAKERAMRELAEIRMRWLVDEIIKEKPWDKYDYERGDEKDPGAITSIYRIFCFDYSKTCAAIDAAMKTLDI